MSVIPTRTVPAEKGRASGPGRRRVVNGVAEPTYAVRGLKGIFLVLCCALVLMPFLMVISTSLADPDQVNAAGGYVIWPDNPGLDSYRAIFAGGIVTRALVVSVGITVVGTVLSLGCITLLAYSLSRPGTFGHKPAVMLVLFSILFSPGIIPNYLLIQQLGLLDTYWSLILPTLVTGFQVIIMRAFFLELPQELIDAARIDGASEFQILTRIVLPLSKAVIAVIGLFQAVAYWNSFFTALLYITDTTKWPLQLVLRFYVVNDSPIAVDSAELMSQTPPPQESLQMAILVISLVPIILIYPFLQRHFAKGVMIGSVKG